MTAKKSSQAKIKLQTSSKRAAGTEEAELVTTPVASTEPLTKQPAPKPIPNNHEASVAGTGRLPHSWQILREAVALLWGRKKLFVVIAAVYIVCNLLLVQTANATNLAQIKSSLAGSGSGGPQAVSTGFALFSALIVRSGSGVSQAGGAYQSFLLIIISLALVWALRESMAGRSVRARDSFYKGMYPLVPSILVLLAVFVQLIPLAIGSAIFGIVNKNGIATSGLQIGLWSLILIAGLCTSVYLVLSSVFAAYIVTLPDMTPLRALRSARKLVRYRRWTVLRKLLFLAFALLLVMTLIMLPFLFWLVPVASWIFFLLSTIALVIYHAYMYVLYRKLLV